MPNYNQVTKKEVQAIGIEELLSVKVITKEEAREITEDKLPIGLFMFKDKGIYKGIDNTKGDAWLEEFNQQEECIKWLLSNNENGAGEQKEVTTKKNTDAKGITTTIKINVDKEKLRIKSEKIHRLIDQLNQERSSLVEAISIGQSKKDTVTKDSIANKVTSCTKQEGDGERNKCPRCENEEILETHNFCKICGLKLKTNQTNTIEEKKECTERLNRNEKHPVDSMMEYIKIEKNTVELFTEEEKEVALNISKQLIGITVFRATKILKFCLEAVHVARV